MKFWPLFIAIIGTGYYATWRERCWVPLGAAALIGLLVWAMGYSIAGIALAAILTALISPAVFALGMLIYIRFR